MNKEYKVEFEIAGPAAMFTRPDSGAAPISYPAPTYSAIRGICDSIARLKSAHINPIKVEICAPIRYHKYTTNYGGPKRKDMKNSYQLPATILIDVCYRVYGIAEERTIKPLQTNHLHHLQEMFMRRIEKGQVYEMPCLGWREFVPNYIGRFRETTQVESSLEMIIPSMLHSVFESNESYAPVYKQNVWIKNGVINYAE